jgi:hypothetical protein
VRIVSSQGADCVSPQGAKNLQMYAEKKAVFVRRLWLLFELAD